MGITDRTRKFLWAKSGNRCAICKVELLTKKSNEHLNIGEECHIISSKPKGPRHKCEFGDYDVYENLILLCRNHHIEIDQLEESYTEELLQYMKLNHENWVRNTIQSAIDLEKEKRPRFLSRITSGKELLNLITDVYGYRTDYDEPDNEQEIEYIAGTLQNLIDYGEVSSMVETSDKIKIGGFLKEIIDDLETNGYFLFADRSIEDYKHGKTVFKDWSVATLVIRKKENPEIIKVGSTD